MRLANQRETKKNKECPYDVKVGMRRGTFGTTRYARKGEEAGVYVGVWEYSAILQDNPGRQRDVLIQPHTAGYTRLRDQKKTY